MKIIDIKNQSQADPYVIYDNGKYYLYCTGYEGVPVYESENLEYGWKYMGICFKGEGQINYWAPSVLRLGNRYYMYYSSMPTDSDDVHTQSIKVAVSDCATGPFVYVKDLLPPFSIDPHVVQNSEGLFMFYSVNCYEGEKVGTYIVVDAMTDVYTMAGNPKAVIRPKLEEEIYQKDRFQAGQDWYTIEGAFYFKEKGVHYCMYSANSFMKPTYHIGYTVSTDSSDKLNEIDFHRAFEGYHPLIAADETEQSTGHNSVIAVNGQKFVVYHGRDISSDLTVNERTARICKLFAENGVLTVERR